MTLKGMDGLKGNQYKFKCVATSKGFIHGVFMELNGIPSRVERINTI